MRRIMFRGKRFDNGEWVRGFYTHFYDSKGRNSSRIYPSYAATDCEEFYPDYFEVDPATIGQYIGFEDANNQPIFEGDLVTICNTKKQGLPAPVRFSDAECAFVLARNGYNPIHLFPDSDVWYLVVGNIYDK